VRSRPNRDPGKERMARDLLDAAHGHDAMPERCHRKPRVHQDRCNE